MSPKKVDLEGEKHTYEIFHLLNQEPRIRDVFNLPTLELVPEEASHLMFRELNTKLERHNIGLMLTNIAI
jgi:hypothetical protein